MFDDELPKMRRQMIVFSFSSARPWIGNNNSHELCSTCRRLAASMFIPMNKRVANFIMIARDNATDSAQRTWLIFLDRNVSPDVRMQIILSPSPTVATQNISIRD